MLAGRSVCMMFRTAISSALFAGFAGATPLIPLRVVESSHENPGRSLGELVDGNLNPDNGLDMAGGQFEEQTIVFATEKPLSAQVFQLSTWHQSAEKGCYPARIEFAVTSDDRPRIGGNWKPLRPDLVVTDAFPWEPQLVRVIENVIHIGGVLDQMVIAMRAPTSLTGVTGFRLRFIPGEIGHPSGRETIGYSHEGSFVINEFQAQMDPLRSSNVALGRPVRASGVVYGGLHPHFLTDGFPASFSHPEEFFPARGFYFEIDLGTSRALDYLVLRNRIDGKVPERLGNYQVQLFDDDGTGNPGKLRWMAWMRQDGSHVPNGGRDIIQAEDGTGESFAGRFLRILNPSDAPVRPQVSEVEVYPELHPRIAAVRADGRAIDLTDALPPGTKTLEFAIAAGKSDPVPELLVFRWRRPGADGSGWRECRGGELVAISCEVPGVYPVEFQARHTDGRWSRQVQTHRFLVPTPWWKSAFHLGAVALASVLSVAGLGWWFSVRRLRHKLALAQAASAIEQDRLRIARDMHDDIGARLTHMALLADRVRRSPGQEAPLLSKLAGEARDTVGALDQIVWAVNPRHDTLGSFSDYLCHHATGYLADAGLSCHFNLPRENRGAVLPFAIRHPLLMVVKEALQNVVKHAGARKVAISLAAKADRIELTVCDDGKGIVDTDDPANGDGLANMRSRLAEIGGSCAIGKSPSGGTQIIFSVPWTPAS